MDVLDGATIADLRRKKQLTQERLAELMRVDVTTVARWEIGLTLPSIQNDIRLREILCTIDGLKHPFVLELLQLEFPVAVMDGFAVYREANSVFLETSGLRASELIGRPAVECWPFWEDAFRSATGITPEELATSDIAEIEIADECGHTGHPVLHAVSVLRQSGFSAVSLHRLHPVSELTDEHRTPRIKRRFDRSPLPS